MYLSHGISEYEGREAQKKKSELGWRAKMRKKNKKREENYINAQTNEKHFQRKRMNRWNDLKQPVEHVIFMQY